MSKKVKMILVGLCASVVVGCAATALLLIGPSDTGKAEARLDQALAAASERITAALGVAAAEIRTHNGVPAQERAGAQLDWSNGLATIDIPTGQILSLYQEPRKGFDGASPVLIDSETLDARASSVISLLGWTEEALAASGLKPDSAGITAPGLFSFTKTWAAYTAGGMRTNGQITVEIDARDQQVLSFSYFPGVGNVEVEPAKLAETDAHRIALETVTSHLTTSASELTVSGTELVVTDAQGVTGGKVTLLWIVTIQGTDSEGVAVGGWVYIDAYTGEVLKYFPC